MRKTGVFLLTILFALEGVGARAFGEADNAAQRSAIVAALKESLESGVREENVEKLLSVYRDDAVIVNYIWGRVDKPTLGKKMAEDFAQITPEAVKLIVLDVTFEEAGAIVLINLSTRGNLTNGTQANRNDRYYLQMERTGEGWQVVRQSYRRDFGVSGTPAHGIPVHGRPDSTDAEAED
jgi:ketosteroid isomerase-like protein